MKTDKLYAIGALAAIVLALSAFVSAPSAAQNCNAEADLSGSITFEDGLARGIVTNASESCSYDVGLASYERYDDNVDYQALFDANKKVIGPGGTQIVRVQLPACSTQVDLFWGDLLESLNGQRYGDRLIAARTTSDPFCDIPDDEYTCPPDISLSVYLSEGAGNTELGQQVSDGQGLGTLDAAVVNIQAIIDGTDDDSRVVFDVAGPQSATHEETVAPFYFLGDGNLYDFGIPNGWDLNTAPAGDYAMNVAFYNGPRLCDSAHFSFVLEGGSDDGGTDGGSGGGVDDGGTGSDSGDGSDGGGVDDGGTGSDSGDGGSGGGVDDGGTGSDSGDGSDGGGVDDGGTGSDSGDGSDGGGDDGGSGSGGTDSGSDGGGDDGGSGSGGTDSGSDGGGGDDAGSGDTGGGTDGGSDGGGTDDGGGDDGGGDTDGGSDSGGGGTDPVDLSVDITALSDVVAAGDPVRFSYLVRNESGSDASGVIVSTDFDGPVSVANQGSCRAADGSLRCAIGSLAAGAETTFNVTVGVQQLAVIQAEAFVTVDQVDDNDSNDSDTAEVIVGEEKLTNRLFELNVNGDRIPDGWATFGDFGGQDGIYCGIPQVESGQCTVALFAGSSNLKALIQSVSVTGTAGDTFTYSVYAAGRNVNGVGAMNIMFSYTDGTSENFTLPFNGRLTESYQLYSLTVTAAKPYSSIRVGFGLEASAGVIGVDTASLFRWPTGYTPE